MIGIFPVFMNALNKNLPKCEVAYSIRQSCLYTLAKNYHIDTKISENYPIKYYYIQGGYTTSFYYNKNNLILYYIHSMQNNNSRVIPLYDYVKDSYEIILSDFPYYHERHHDVCIVKTPNRQVYLIGVASKSFVIANVSNGTILCNFEYDFSKNTTYLSHSMPIANSFVLVVTRESNEIVTHIIDLINERIKSQKYPVEKIVEKILVLAKGFGYYNAVKFIKNLDALFFNGSAINSIDASMANLVFYDMCIINISLSVGNNESNEKKLINALSVVATYQNNELTVRLQINDNMKVKTSRSYYEINFGSSTVLVSNTYKIDNKYDIFQSRLYSVIASFDDYTIASESNMKHPDTGAEYFILYCDNKPDRVLQNTYLETSFKIHNLGDILFIKASNKRIAAVRKNRLIKLNKVDKYYIEGNAKCIEVIDIESVRNLALSRMRRNNDTHWVGVDITDKVKRVHLKDELKKIILHDFCYDTDLILYACAYYEDYTAEELYSLVWFRCYGKVEPGLKVPQWDRVYLFKSKIKSLVSGHISFRLVRQFEIDNFMCSASILDGLKLNESTSDGRLRLLSNKWNTGYGCIDLRFFKMYDKLNAYYDYGYNRKSTGVVPTDMSIVCTLHLVHRILPICGLPSC
jgi:hypothetical protein